MKSILSTSQTDPEWLSAMLAALRCMARLHGDSELSLRIALSGEKCERCQRVSEALIEPPGVCVICWSILILNKAVKQLNKPFEGINSQHDRSPVRKIKL